MDPGLTDDGFSPPLLLLVDVMAIAESASPFVLIERGVKRLRFDVVDDDDDDEPDEQVDEDDDDDEFEDVADADDDDKCWRVNACDERLRR